MDQHVVVDGTTPPKTGCIALAVCGMLLWLIAAGAHAASVYKCVDAQGHLAYRDTPCAADAQQRKLDLRPLPTIGDPSEVAASKRAPTHYARPWSRERKTARARKPSMRATRPKPETSWECRAADGEVFYRHRRCPSSIPGDGVVRGDYAETQSGKRSRGRRDAWARVRVHGTKIPRAEACRRIHSAGAAGRDGRTHDETVSTYDHLMGRDPCGG